MTDSSTEARAIWPHNWTPPAPAATHLTLSDAGEVVEVFARGVEAMGAAIVPAMVRLHAELVEAGLVADEPPTDPRARALHLRRHRNTGPALPPPGRR